MRPTGVTFLELFGPISRHKSWSMLRALNNLMPWSIPPGVLRGESPCENRHWNFHSLKNMIGKISYDCSLSSSWFYMLLISGPPWHESPPKWQTIKIETTSLMEARQSSPQTSRRCWCQGSFGGFPEWPDWFNLQTIKQTECVILTSAEKCEFWWSKVAVYKRLWICLVCLLYCSWLAVAGAWEKTSWSWRGI